MIGARGLSMTIKLHRSCERGYADHGWLESYHSFSFADFYHPARMGVGNLRVINEDRIAPGTGFAMHGHRDMEIVSYVLEGALAHQDSMGNGVPGSAHAGVILPGDVQRMSAGTGVRHSEYNHDATRTTHFLQIWILPDAAGIAPGYEQKRIDAASKRGRLRLIASPDGREASVTVHADARLYAGLFDGAESASLPARGDRPQYVHVVRGAVSVNGQALRGGDAVELRGEGAVQISHGSDAEVLVFDLHDRAAA
jgi:redox-sensitive bicupin YhaK (pirin superfamily)